MGLNAVCVHGHFYQPPREDPLSGLIPDEIGAEPYKNWNERIHAECYQPNAVLGNFEKVSFNIGPTLLNWMEEYDRSTYDAIIAQERSNFERHGVGNGMAQAYNHVILPLASKRDKVTQIKWGIADFQHRFGHNPLGMWLPETAVDLETLAFLADNQIKFTMLAPRQIEGFDKLDDDQPYLIKLPGNRDPMIIFLYNQNLSTSVSFQSEATRNAEYFVDRWITPNFNFQSNSPILNPLRELISSENLKNIYQIRQTEVGENINSENVTIHTEKFRRFIEAIQDFVSVNGEIAPIIREEQRGLEALLKLPIFGERYPFPGSKKYKKTLSYIQNDLDNYPFIWYVLIIWNDLRLIGRVITSDPQFVEIGRSWIDEWALGRTIQQSLAQLGLDHQQAVNAVNLIKLLVSQQNWMDEIANATPGSIMRIWLSSEEIRNFLNVNRYRGRLWFNKEAFESMMWWMTTIELINLVADPNKSLTEMVENLLDAHEIIEAIITAGVDSEYQVEKLLEGLK